MQLNASRPELQQLYTPPTNELTTPQLVSWANQLQDLEHQVRDRVSAPTKESS